MYFYWLSERMQDNLQELYWFLASQEKHGRGRPCMHTVPPSRPFASAPIWGRRQRSCHLSSVKTLRHTASAICISVQRAGIRRSSAADLHQPSPQAKHTLRNRTAARTCNTSVLYHWVLCRGALQRSDCSRAHSCTVWWRQRSCAQRSLVSQRHHNSGCKRNQEREQWPRSKGRHRSDDADVTAAASSSRHRRQHSACSHGAGGRGGDARGLQYRDGSVHYS